MNACFVNKLVLRKNEGICVVGRTVTFCRPRVLGWERTQFLIDVEDDGGVTESVPDSP